MKIAFVSYDDAALSEAFRLTVNQFRCPVELFEGDIIKSRCDAFVSPANSFGFMDGGINWMYLKVFGEEIQQRVFNEIRSLPFCELLVGQAIVVPTDCEGTSLVVAPTMRVPQILAESINPYLATRAALRAASLAGIESIAFPAMGAGIGRVPPELCAFQMCSAVTDYFGKVPSSDIWTEQLQQCRLLGIPDRDMQLTAEEWSNLRNE